MPQSEQPFDSPDNYLQGEVDGEPVLIMRSSTEVYQNDIRDLLLALGLSPHARPYSPHEVMWREILPAVRKLVRDHAAE